jgi:hypothetical protein
MCEYAPSYEAEESRSIDLDPQILTTPMIAALVDPVDISELSLFGYAKLNQVQCTDFSKSAQVSQPSSPSTSANESTESTDSGTSISSPFFSETVSFGSDEHPSTLLVLEKRLEMQENIVLNLQKVCAILWK